MSSFHRDSLEFRRQLGGHQKDSNDNKLPFILEKGKNSGIVGNLPNKFLFSGDQPLLDFLPQLQDMVQQKLKNNWKNNELQLFVNDRLVNKDWLIVDIYEKYKSNDGFVHAEYREKYDQVGLTLNYLMKIFGCIIILLIMLQIITSYTYNR